MIFFLASLYPDGIFSVAATGLLFELWLVASRRNVGRGSLAMVALTLPFAAFARPNGLIFLAPIIAVLFLLDKTSRRWLALITALWCALAFAGARAHRDGGHGVLFPLALFETVGFLQPRAMNLPVDEPRVSAKTIALLSNHHALENIVKNYDPDYWDPLYHKPDGPRLGDLPKQSKKALVHEFFYLQPLAQHTALCREQSQHFSCFGIGAGRHSFGGIRAIRHPENPIALRISKILLE